MGLSVAVLLEQTLAPVPGGAGRYAGELAAALARRGSAGDTVTGWTAWHRDVGAARAAGVAGPRRLLLPRRPLIAAWERGVGPVPRPADLVHATTLLAPPRRGVPLVVSIHDAVPWTHPQTLTPRGVRWHRAMAARVAQSADAVTVLTETAGAELAEVLPSIADRITVLGAGVAADLARDPDPAFASAAAERLRLPARYLLTLATLEPRKGLDVLVTALAQLGAGAPTLLVVGQPGWGDVDLPGTARRAGLPADRVRPLGRLPDRDLAVVLRGADALVAPSRAEGFGLPVAEAMAAGTPVICSDAPALVEVAGDAAVVVPRGDAAALAAAIDGLDAGTLERLAAAGRRRSGRYTWDAVADRAWTLYRSLGGR